MRKTKILRSTYVRKLTTQVPDDIHKEVQAWNAEHPLDQIKWQECLARGARFFLIEKKGIGCFDDVAPYMPLQARLIYEDKVKKLQELSQQIRTLTGGQ